MLLLSAGATYRLRCPEFRWLPRIWTFRSSICRSGTWRQISQAWRTQSHRLGASGFRVTGKSTSTDRRVLDETIRPVVQLNDTEQKRLAAAHDMLTRMVDAIDLTTGGTKKVPADTPLYEA